MIATDTEPYRLELAQRMGADLVLDARSPDMVERVMHATGGDGVEVLLEMSGAAPALIQALGFVTRGGRVSLLGIFGEPVTIDLPRRSSSAACACTASTAGASTTPGSARRRCCAPARST